MEWPPAQEYNGDLQARTSHPVRLLHVAAHQKRPNYDRLRPVRRRYLVRRGNHHRNRPQFAGPCCDATVIDATGKYVFPGFIDPHVHIYLPFMGTFSKDDYDSGSRAALVGGTTTLIEMCCPSRQEEPLDGFNLWMSKAEGISACDFSFHMGVSRYDASAEEQLREIVKRGIASFKIFLAYKGAFGIDDNELYKTLKLAKELGVIVTAHCENAELVSEMQKRLISEGKTGPEWHEPSRPVRVEAEGVHHLMTFAELTGAHVYTVHTSNSDAIWCAAAARERGVRVWIETVAPYLVLDETYAQKSDFEGRSL